MPLLDDIENTRTEAIAAFAAAADAKALEEARIKYLGTKGRVKELLSALGKVMLADRDLMDPYLGGFAFSLSKPVKCIVKISSNEQSVSIADNGCGLRRIAPSIRQSKKPQLSIKRGE